VVNLSLSREHAKVIVGVSDNRAQLVASDFDAAKKEWEAILLSEDGGDGEEEAEGDGCDDEED
jgi:hypothetical protein